MAAATLSPWPRRARPAAPLLAFAFAVVALVVVSADRGLRPSDGSLTSYVGMSRLAAVADVTAGIGLLAVAAVALWSPLTVRLGAAALLAAVAWFAPDFEGWTNGGRLIHSLGTAAVPLFPAALTWLVVVGARGRVRPRGALVALGVGIAVVCVAAVIRALVRDPLLDPYCWRNCIDNVFLVHASPGSARDLDRVWLGTTVALGMGLAAASTGSFVFGTRAARRLAGPVLVTGALAGVAQATYALKLLADPVEGPLRRDDALLFYARAFTVTALAAALLWSVISLWRTRASVARLARALAEAPAPGRLQSALAETFGDQSLEVRYWLPHARRYVDGDGRAVEAPVPDATHAVTPILRNGSAVAAVVHDPALVGASFERELGSAARLAVENERLQAEVRAQVEALRRSRMRITERGDAERRRLERDLHDGAQQRLLALSYDLRLARSGAAGEAAAQLDEAVAEAQRALEELRELAHGIYPAILSEAGPAAALASLADEAPVAVELRVPGDRYDARVEAAVYVAVREAIDDAVGRSATFVRVAIDSGDDSLELAIDDDGVPRTSGLVHVQDRIGALGGTVEVGERALRAVIPCA